jgi:hypothetical protein
MGGWRRTQATKLTTQSHQWGTSTVQGTIISTWRLPNVKKATINCTARGCNIQDTGTQQQQPEIMPPKANVPGGLGFLPLPPLDPMISTTKEPSHCQPKINYNCLVVVVLPKSNIFTFIALLYPRMMTISTIATASVLLFSTLVYGFDPSHSYSPLSLQIASTTSPLYSTTLQAAVYQ